jgi:hypothetical protein
MTAEASEMSPQRHRSFLAAEELACRASVVVAPYSAGTRSSLEASGMTSTIVLTSSMDQLDDDTTLGGPDLEIEVAQEVSS